MKDFQLIAMCKRCGAQVEVDYNGRILRGCAHFNHILQRANQCQLYDAFPSHLKKKYFNRGVFIARLAAVRDMEQCIMSGESYTEGPGYLSRAMEMVDKLPNPDKHHWLKHGMLSVMIEVGDNSMAVGIDEGEIMKITKLSKGYLESLLESVRGMMSGDAGKAPKENEILH